MESLEIVKTVDLRECGTSIDSGRKGHSNGSRGPVKWIRPVIGGERSGINLLRPIIRGSVFVQNDPHISILGDGIGASLLKNPGNFTERLVKFPGTIVALPADHRKYHQNAHDGHHGEEFEKREGFAAGGGKEMKSHQAQRVYYSGSSSSQSRFKPPPSTLKPSSQAPRFK